MLSIDLNGKTVVVTGGTGQLGRVMVKTLIQCGANIAICYNSNVEMAKNLTDEITSGGGRCMAVYADVTDLNSVIEMKEQVNSALGHVDIIVNNAVIQYGWTSIIEQDIADFKSQFESCVLHNVNMSKVFVPDMCQKGYGRVIGINSECAALCDSQTGAYSAAKRGMDGILRCLAKEVGGYGVTVNQVAPGYTITEKDRINGTEIDENYNNTVALGHRGTDVDIANAVAFLASDLASFITGVYLPVCGGRVMPGI